MQNLFFKRAGAAFVRSAAIMILALCAAVLPHSARAQGDPLNGTWNFVPEKSTFMPGPVRYKNLTLTFAGGTMTLEGVDVAGHPVKGVYQAIADGKNHPITGMAEYDNATWSKFNDEATTYTYMKRKTTVALGTRVLSRDGGVLTFNEKTYDSRGKLTEASTMVFTKPGYVFAAPPPPTPISTAPVQTMQGATPDENAAITAMEKGDTDGAIALFSKAIAANGSKPTTMAYYDLISRGILYAKKADNTNAMADFDSAIKAKPGDADAYFRRGGIHVELKQWPQAIDDFTQSINADPMNATAYYLRGFSYNILQKDKEGAADKEKACMLNKDYCMN